MKSLNQYIQEKLIINKDYIDTKIVVKSSDELRKIIEQRYEEYGPGTKRNPIDFNDIDVSNLDSFLDKLDMGIFNDMNFKYIDISDWDVSNIKSMNSMFYWCDELKSVGDLSNWDVSNVMLMRTMFSYCSKLKSLGDISCWDVSNVTDMRFMFEWCESFNQDISNWNVSNETYMDFMFHNCPIKDEYKPKFK